MFRYRVEFRAHERILQGMSESYLSYIAPAVLGNWRSTKKGNAIHVNESLLCCMQVRKERGLRYLSWVWFEGDVIVEKY